MFETIGRLFAMILLIGSMLRTLIAESRIEKKVMQVETADFAGSFRR